MARFGVLVTCHSSLVTLHCCSMIIGKSKKEIEKMRAAGQLTGLVLQQLREMAEPGISTLEIDRAAEKMIRDAGGLPTFKGYHGFPYSICASVNEQVVHGFPSDYKLKDGDIFSIDCGVTLGGVRRRHRHDSSRRQGKRRLVGADTCYRRMFGSGH